MLGQRALGGIGGAATLAAPVGDRAWEVRPSYSFAMGPQCSRCYHFMARRWIVDDGYVQPGTEESRARVVCPQTLVT